MISDQDLSQALPGHFLMHDLSPGFSTLPEHPNSSRFIVEFSVQCFVDRCLSFCTFSFDNCVVSPLISGFWLPPWYLQTCLKTSNLVIITNFCSVNLSFVMVSRWLSKRNWVCVMQKRNCFIRIKCAFFFSIKHIEAHMRLHRSPDIILYIY